MELKNKNIVITGGTDGIGLEVVKKLITQQANVIVVGRNSEKLKDYHVRFYPCDRTINQAITEVVQNIIQDVPDIHGLLNIAGVWQKKGPLEEIDDLVISNVISTNLTGLITITKKLLPTLKLQPESLIINVASRSGVIAQEGQSVYCASKFGVYGFTESLRLDLKNSPVKIAGVYQGGVNTKFFEKAGDLNVPYQTFTDPTDLAEVIVFLMSRPKNIWINDIRLER